MDDATTRTDSTATSHAGRTIEFAARIPLLNNRFILWDFAKAMAISVAVLWLSVFLGSLVIDASDPLLLPWQLPAICVGVIAVCYVIACLVLGNGYAAVFRIDDAGVAWDSGPKEKTINRAVTLVGAVAGSPGAAGSGLLAQGNETGIIPWTKVRRLNIHRGPRVISVRNSWRVVVRLYVPAELWDAVVARLEAGVAGGSAPKA